MGLFLRPAENFSLLLVSKKEIEGNALLVLPYIFCAICPFFFPLLLAFSMYPLEVTSVSIVFCGHSSSPGSRAVALHQPWHMAPPAQGKGWACVESWGYPGLGDRTRFSPCKGIERWSWQEGRNSSSGVDRVETWSANESGKSVLVSAAAEITTLSAWRIRTRVSDASRRDQSCLCALRKDLCPSFTGSGPTPWPVMELIGHLSPGSVAVASQGPV